MKENKYNLFVFLLILNQIIDSPSSVTSQKLDNIIYLGSSGFAYSNFATFSNGSLVIESSEDKGSTARIFYGITRDGNPLFESNNYFLSLSVADDYQRKDSENFIIKMNDNTKKEYLISMGNNLYIEIYDLGAKSVVHKFKSDTYSNMHSMDSVVQTAISYSDGSNFYIYHAYLNIVCYLVVKKLKFNSPYSYDTVNYAYLPNIYGKIAACFMTNKKYIVCLTILKKNASLFSSYIYVYVFDEKLENSVYDKQLDSYTIDIDSKSKTYSHFYKALHLKEEIGVFAFYKESEKYLNLVFKSYDSSNKKLIEYISPITLNKYETNVNNLLNDIIKAGKDKLCFFATSDNKDVMYIVLINIYNDKNAAIRYYTFDIFNTYGFKFYINMRGNLYNNFISFSFSFCPSSSCNSNSDIHYPGLIIFSYPNGTDTNIDLINEMINTNKKIDSITINLKNQVRIDNNIFGLEYYAIQIDEIIDCDFINFTSSKNKDKIE